MGLVCLSWLSGSHEERPGRNLDEAEQRVRGKSPRVHADFSLHSACLQIARDRRGQRPPHGFLRRLRAAINEIASAPGTMTSMPLWATSLFGAHLLHLGGRDPRISKADRAFDIQNVALASGSR